jgi:hypothetical protein
LTTIAVKLIKEVATWMSTWCRTLDEVVDGLKVSQNRRRRQLWKVGKLVQSLEPDSAVQVGHEKRNCRKE